MSGTLTRDEMRSRRCKSMTLDTVRAKADTARARATLHAQLCGLIYARKDAADLAEEAIDWRRWDDALAAVALARDLDAEYERKEVAS